MTCTCRHMWRKMPRFWTRAINIVIRKPHSSCEIKAKPGVLVACFKALVIFSFIVYLRTSAITIMVKHLLMDTECPVCAVITLYLYRISYFTSSAARQSRQSKEQGSWAERIIIGFACGFARAWGSASWWKHRVGAVLPFNMLIAYNTQHIKHTDQ